MLVVQVLAACQFQVEATRAPESAAADPGTGEVAELPAAMALADAADEGLTEDAKEAVGLVPTWMRADVELSLRKLGEEDQDLVSGALLGLANPGLADEVGFAIAHLPWRR